MAALEGIPDGAHQCVVAERLRQELGRARFHSLDRHRDVAVTGDEDDRHIHPLGGDTSLQIEAVEARKRHVKHQAAWRSHSWTGEEFLRRRECMDLETELHQKVGETSAHRLVAVDDRYERSHSHQTVLSTAQRMANANVAPGPSFGSAQASAGLVSMISLRSRSLPLRASS